MGIYYGEIVGVKVLYYESNSANDVKIAKISVESLEKYGGLSGTHSIRDIYDSEVLSAAKAVIVEKLKLNDVHVINITKLLKEEIDTYEGWNSTGRYIWTDIGEF